MIGLKYPVFGPNVFPVFLHYAVLVDIFRFYLLDSLADVDSISIVVAGNCINIVLNNFMIFKRTKIEAIN